MPTLYDHLDRPVRLDELRREIATATVTGVRSVWHESVASGLTPARLATILNAAAQGDADAYLTLAEEMEEREPHYHSVLGTRKLAVSGLEVSVEAASEEARDVELADEIRALVQQPEFQDLIDDQLDALGKGYSVSEILWDRSGPTWKPRVYEWRDPRFFRFDTATGRRLLLRDEQDSFRGIELAPYKFIIHQPRLKTGLPIRGGLARLAAVAYMCKSYTLKDWMAFMEVFGQPIRIGRYGPGAKDDDIRTLVHAVANLASDAAAVIPDSMKIELPSVVSAGGGLEGFQRLGDWLDKQVSKGVLGQTMTTDDGSSKSQAEVHNEVRGDLVKADGRQLAKTLNRDLVRPYVTLNHGPQPAYPRILMQPPKREDLKLLSEALPPFVDRGLQVEAAVIRDKFGLPEPEKGAEVLRPQGGASASPAPSPALQRERNRGAGTDAVDELAAELAEEWKPTMTSVLDPIRELARRADSFEQFIAELPSVLAEVDSEELVRKLALALFEARGMGDATDTI